MGALTASTFARTRMAVKRCVWWWITNRAKSNSISLLMEHGLQLQLAAYLNVLRHWPDPRPVFGVSRLVPAGVFYVNLRGDYDREPNRDEALAGWRWRAN